MSSYNNEENKIRRKKVGSPRPTSDSRTKSSRSASANYDNVYDIKDAERYRNKQSIKRNKKTPSNQKSSSASLESVRNTKRAKKTQRRNKIIKSILAVVLTLTLIGSLFGVGFTLYAIQGAPKVTKELIESNYISSQVASSKEIPDNLKKAIVSIEDERFYTHNGIDKISLVRSLVNNIRTDTTQGASTIDMQVSKNLLTNNEKTMKRKIRDMYNAIQMNKVMTKDEILVTYLNNMYLGKSTYGVAKGANVYFAKNVEDLNLAECAMIAGITNNPARYEIYGEAKKRQERVLFKMNELGYINESEYKKALREDVHFKSEID
ncbi:transglycosylase domain-containing protein [Clostridioides mangenotii]|uniref:biosynthetic peptidoglycan transglycosylase n=1 Tax=Metaclostridioides mangenotii TaxID=1540 RepID=UPI001C0F65B3|nr:biosynthetic peptidoglycan transglycosylase [Clostridioides mangenotii]MBU5307737.1 transglycosylase domain-containing protein [Clostridioides mangenotii]MCR1955997.1 transglycosylase domain-containing protein [Clostridioides mangenotii]